MPEEVTGQTGEYPMYFRISNAMQVQAMNSTPDMCFLHPHDFDQLVKEVMEQMMKITDGSLEVSKRGGFLFNGVEFFRDFKKKERGTITFVRVANRRTVKLYDP